jgi:hypothetical protein
MRIQTAPAFTTAHRISALSTIYIDHNHTNSLTRFKFDVFHPEVFTVYIGQTKRISQTQQCSVTKQHYIILVELHVPTLPELSSGPQVLYLEGLKMTQVESKHVALLI